MSYSHLLGYMAGGLGHPGDTVYSSNLVQGYYCRTISIAHSVGTSALSVTFIRVSSEAQRSSSGIMRTRLVRLLLAFLGRTVVLAHGVVFLLLFLGGWRGAAGVEGF